MTDRHEATVTIDGRTLSHAEVMTLRVAITEFAERMAASGALGNDTTGEAIRRGYRRHADRLTVELVMSCRAKMEAST